MIESGIRGEKGPVDARTNVKEKKNEGKRRDCRKAKVLRCVGATTVVCRELNGGCVDVTFQSKGEDEGGGGGEKRRSKVRPAGSSPHLTAFYAIYTFESVADDDRGLHRIVLGALSTPLYGVTIDEATSRHANWPLFFSSRPFSFFLSPSFSLFLSIFDLHCRVCKSPSFRSAWDFGATYIFTRDERACICKEITL